MDFANKFLENISILSFDSKSVFESRKIYLDLKNRNKLIELPDIFIAGTAIANDLPVSNLILKHFERIEGLEIILSILIKKSFQIICRSKQFSPLISPPIFVFAEK